MVKSYINLKFWLTAAIFILFITNISAAAVNSKNYVLVADRLAALMSKDLADRSLKVEIIRASEMEMSKNRRIFFGEAMYISGKAERQTPVYFEAVVDKNTVAMVDYTFLEDAAGASDVFLQKLLLKKLGADYRTDEIVISIDDVERIRDPDRTEKFRGFGEARIGSLIWKKIRFEIRLAEDGEKILYRLEDI